MKKVLHEKSRKFLKAKREIIRKERLNHEKGDRIKNKVHTTIDRLTWFQLILEEDKNTLSESEIHELLELYLSRYDDKLAELKSSLRPNRPIPKKIHEIESVQFTEMDEYKNSGLEIPDLTLEDNVKRFKAWSGDYNSISLIKMKRFKKPVDMPK